MSQPLIFPNIENLVVGFLASRTELAGVPVAVRLPTDYDGSSAIVVVSRVGGEFAADDRLDQSLLRIDTYGPDWTAALDLGGRVRGLIWLMPDVAGGTGTAIADIAEQRGPSRLRDHAFPNASRYTTRYQVLVRVSLQQP
jgi:hypothetical protein